MIKKGNLKTLLQLSALAYEIEQILKKQIDIVVEEIYTKDINYDSETIKLAKNIFYNEVKKEFEVWKKQAKEKITKLKHGELTEDEVYKWLQENK